MYATESIMVIHTSGFDEGICLGASVYTINCHCGRLQLTGAGGDEISSGGSRNPSFKICCEITQ